MRRLAGAFLVASAVLSIFWQLVCLVLGGERIPENRYCIDQPGGFIGTLVLLGIFWWFLLRKRPPPRSAV